MKRGVLTQVRANHMGAKAVSPALRILQWFGTHNKQQPTPPSDLRGSAEKQGKDLQRRDLLRRPQQLRSVVLKVCLCQVKSKNEWQHFAVSVNRSGEAQWYPSHTFPPHICRSEEWFPHYPLSHQSSHYFYLPPKPPRVLVIATTILSSDDG